MEYCVSMSPPLFAINVGHWEYGFSMSHVFRNWGDIEKKYSQCPAFFCKQGGQLKTVFPMSHAL